MSEWWRDTVVMQLILVWGYIRTVSCRCDVSSLLSCRMRGVWIWCHLLWQECEGHAELSGQGRANTGAAAFILPPWFKNIKLPPELLCHRSSAKSGTSISPTSLASSVKKPGTSRRHMMWVNVSYPHCFETYALCNWHLLRSWIIQKRRGMDIQQMKTFVSEELKGLKQEHRLLSLRECRSTSLSVTLIVMCW